MQPEALNGIMSKIYERKVISVPAWAVELIDNDDTLLRKSERENNKKVETRIRLQRLINRSYN